MNIREKIVLFIAPLPPPIDGQSKASGMALQAMRNSDYLVKAVNLNRSSLNRSFGSQINRVLEVFFIFLKIAVGARRSELIYISLSESLLGNFKDLVIYCILFRKLDRVTLHMLGGTGMNVILNERPFLSKINGFFMRRMSKVLVEGSRGHRIFEKYFNANQIYTIPNFVDDHLISSESSIIDKFTRSKKIQILYLSNMLPGKGYLDLFEAFVGLPDSAKERLVLKFVGGFSSTSDREHFLSLILGYPNIEYLGSFIDGDEKKALYMNSHVFCLPTYYPYEGQPISILEAYATGCVVLTTQHAGIPDIFAENVNGYVVSSRNPESIRRSIIKVLNDLDAARDIALRNANEAHSKYQSSTFRANFINAIKNN
ncbi:glycosyltransferase family 4 protein [Hydrogenophaga sp.]|uniref:glycosyltransferase family 4 protein n=1 Tax=Hydrogenophaga sp. TaxID=1904254 RepID=UPI0035B0632C